jgi:hypothetical protein
MVIETLLCFYGFVIQIPLYDHRSRNDDGLDNRIGLQLVTFCCYKRQR